MLRSHSRAQNLHAVKPKVLLTGFEPFDGDTVNSSLLAVEALRGKEIAGHCLVVAALPTAFDAALEVLRGLLTAHRPKLVICVGQSGSRAFIALERVALNLIDARIPDNRGLRPIDTPIIPKGPVAYFGTLPVKKILAELRKAGMAVEVSESAGTFVCNYVYYGLMHELSAAFKGVSGGFIHVPIVPQQAESPDRFSMPLDQIVTALRLAIRISVKERLR